MKKIIYKIIFSLILIAILLITYLSFIGIETKRFNKQISNHIKKINNDLKIDLKTVKLILDPFKLEFNVKTIGPKLKIKEKAIEIESIRTYVSINSLINDKFSLKNLEISTKSLDVRNLISFLRNYKNYPQLYFLEKITKKGYLILDLKFEFDPEGKIKKNYEIKGFVKDAKINLLKKNNFDKINFTFNLANNIYQIENIQLNYNQIPFQSKKIILNKINNEFLVEGTIENNNLFFNSEKNNTFLDELISKYEIENIKMNLSSDFIFRINQKFQIKDLKLSSKINIHDLILRNRYKLKKFFPNSNENIRFKDHILKLNFDKNNLSIDGKGNIFIQNNDDFIKYEIKKKNEKYSFNTSLEINKNPILIKSLNYKKNADLKMNLILNGSYIPDKEIIFKTANLKENNNEFSLKELYLDQDFKIKKLNNFKFRYQDNNNKKNELQLYQENNRYFLKGTSFNANNLINEYINDQKEQKLNKFIQDFDVKINIDRVFLDNTYQVKNFKGDLSFKDNEIFNANIKANFSDKQKLKFTVNTKNEEKVTTLFLDKAEPLIKKYKFIKGFKGGSLDFYSIKKNNETISNLKIYNFKLKKLPILTKLLTLASLQGIADILSGDGITFDEFEMNFKSQNNLITIDEMYSIGPAISILMDGYIEKDKLVSLKGSLVPATTINKVIGTIPILGNILVGSKTGEGVFGVSFKIKGPPSKLETTVNPIKTLTPRFITRTLEKIKKN